MTDNDELAGILASDGSSRFVPCSSGKLHEIAHCGKPGRQHAPVVREAMSSLANTLRTSSGLNAGAARRIAEGLLEPDHAKRQAFVRAIEMVQGPRAARKVDRAFGEWLGQYEAAPAGASRQTGR